MKLVRALIAAGGTGGDLFPALAVVEALRTMPDLALNAVFVGNGNRIEGKVIPSLGFDFFHIPVRGLGKLLSIETLLVPFKVAASFFKVRRLMKRYQTNLVVCGGTYVSLPTAYAAKSLGIPIVALEPNVVPGKTNRLVAPMANLVNVAFAETIGHFDRAIHDRFAVLGNPIRQQVVLALQSKDQAACKESLGLDPGKPTVFFLGGSLGAKSINRFVESQASTLFEQGAQILWQRGREYTSSLHNPMLVSQEFVEEMGTWYGAADLVVSRAGGGTVAELALAARPSILIPYPHAANKEQNYNAEVLASHGAAIVVEDTQIGTELLPRIIDVLFNSARRESMEVAAKKMAQPNAALKVAQRAVEFVR